MFRLGKLSLVITTHCNLKCKLCCEYVPQNHAFPDMSVEEEEKILNAAFEVLDYVDTLHLTGGGEPFLHPRLPEMIETAMRYQQRFGRLMLFTNSTVPVRGALLDALRANSGKLLVQASQYGIFPEREQENAKILRDSGVACKFVKYYGDNQDFGGWVDFGPWECQHNSAEALKARFRNCAVNAAMHGNWRTRDGKVHWCSRSQRGMELGLIPDCPEDYVDLLDNSTSPEEKRDKFLAIAGKAYLSACDRCSGDQGTEDENLRHPAAEQMED